MNARPSPEKNRPSASIDPDLSVLAAAAFDLAAEGLVIIDGGGIGACVVHANDRLAAVCGGTVAHLRGRDLCAWLDEADGARLRELIRSAKDTAEALQTEVRFFDHGRMPRRCRVSARRLPGSTTRSFVLLTCTEEKMGGEREQPESVLNCAGFGTWEYDVGRGQCHFDAISANVLGFDSAPIEADADWFQRWAAPGDIDRIRAALLDHVERDAPWFECESRIQTPDGNHRWIYARGRTNRRASDGRVTHLSGVLLDIDARKRAELSIVNTDRHLDIAMNGANVALYTVNLDSNQAFHSSSWFQMSGFDLDEWRSTRDPWKKRLHPDDAERVLKAVHDCLAGASASYEVEYRFLTKSGRAIWLFDRASIVERDANGHPVMLAGTLVDISARRLAEDAQRESEFRYRSVANMTQGYVHESRFDDKALSGYEVVWASTGFTDVFGCSVDEYNRRGGLRAFYLPQELPAAEARIARVKRGERTEGEVRLLDTDGRERWLHTINEPIRHPGTGKVVGMIGVGHDITARKILEREIIEVANREQQRIGSDLHDGLGQELTGIALLLRSFSDQLTREYPKGRVAIDEVIGMVNQTISSARALARGLSPVMLEHGGLIAALRALAAHAKERYGLTVRYRSDARMPLQANAAIANHVYRIAQEALTNSARHSGADVVWLHLRVDATGLRLTISDNGAGIPGQAEMKDGMGLRIMAYRARMIGATLAIENHRRGGLQIRLTCPQVTQAAPQASSDEG